MEKEKYWFVKKWWFWLIIILVIGVIASLGNNDSSKKDENTNNVPTTVQSAKITALSGTNAEEFYNILCDVAGLTKNKPQDLQDALVYESSNNIYNIEVISNKNKEIQSIRIFNINSKDCENLFIALTRLEYNGSNKSALFNFIHDNINKEAETTIGDASFRIYKGTNSKPIIELYIK